ncbi:MAG: DEAD/DEAH box helicase [Bacteroidales bacterium]|jgi:superfamily II DNA/RNA helicase|nr:DEAD/DEAH box helicase [Bacteroidales bacterium]
MTFDELNIHEQLLEAISYMNFEKASPIQEQAIPVAIAGHDILACAQTGTGKTAAFVIPVLHDIVVNGQQGTTTVILTPTRELAIQIHQEIQGFSYFTDTSSKAIFGGDKGKDWDAQKRALVEGTTIIIATPGRLIAHLMLGYVNFKNVRHLILDEADRMLDMGFFDDIQRVLAYLPEDRQTLFFSATMPPAIQSLANKILRNPQKISIAIAKPAAGVTQKAYLTSNNQKVPAILHILEENPDYDSVIIFTSKKSNIMPLVRALRTSKEKFAVAGISSDLEQNEREEVLLQFKAKRLKILVATDVLSRGIDIKGINVVINYDVPGDAADYVHRIGRTARADAKGEAITLINEADMYKFSRIESLIEKEVPKLPLPEEFGAQPVWNPKNSSSFGRSSSGRSRTKAPMRRNSGHDHKSKHHRNNSAPAAEGGEKPTEQGSSEEQKAKPKHNKRRFWGKKKANTNTAPKNDNA